MANLVTTQVLIDGQRNAVVRIDGFIDTIDLVPTVIIDPALLSPVDDRTGQLATQVRVDRITSAIEAPLALYFSWAATTPVRFISLTNAAEEFDYKSFGGIQNNSGIGKTGQITLATQGWTAGAILSFSVTLELTKQ